MARTSWTEHFTTHPPAAWHHAYAILGDREKNSSAFQDLLSAHGISLQGNPDVQIHTTDVLTIEESRALTHFQSTKAFGNGAQFFLLSFSSSTAEAQHALLKVLEEPTSRTHFFLFIPHADVLLPTIQSRLEVHRGDGEIVQKWDERAREFLSQSSEERLAQIEPFMKDHTRSEVREFVEALRALLPKEYRFHTAHAHLMKSSEYLSSPSASPKILLEHLALTLPHTTDFE